MNKDELIKKLKVRIKEIERDHKERPAYYALIEAFGKFVEEEVRAGRVDIYNILHFEKGRENEKAA